MGGFWEHHWVFWVGPVAGAIVGAVAYDLAILRPREQPAGAGAPSGGRDAAG